MNETGANYQQIAKELTSKQLNISVDHGIRNQRNPNYQGSKRMNELNQEATSAREGFRRLVKESAKFLAKMGIASEVMARARRAMAVASWGTRGERVINHLETYNQRPDTRNDKVWKTLDELDKKINVRMCDKDGKITMRPVR